MYQPMLYFLLIGAVLPVPFYLAEKRFPKVKWLKRVHIPLAMSATAAIPPATAINYFPWVMVGLFFSWFVFRRWNGWWLKYNYLLSAGLDTGIALCTFLLFFCFYYPGVELNWWGNVEAFETADVMGIPLKKVAPGETFGSKNWS